MWCICCLLITCFSILVSTRPTHDVRRCCSSGWSAHDDNHNYIVSLQLRLCRVLCLSGVFSQLWSVAYVSMCTFYCHVCSTLCLMFLYNFTQRFSLFAVCLYPYIFYCCTSLYPDVSLWGHARRLKIHFRWNWMYEYFHRVVPKNVDDSQVCIAGLWSVMLWVYKSLCWRFKTHFILKHEIPWPEKFMGLLNLVCEDDCFSRSYNCPGNKDRVPTG